MHIARFGLPGIVGQPLGLIHLCFVIDNISGLISIVLFCVCFLSSELLRTVLAEVTDEPRNLNALTQQKHIFYYIKIQSMTQRRWSILHSHLGTQASSILWLCHSQHVGSKITIEMERKGRESTPTS